MMPHCHDYVKTGNYIALLQNILAAYQTFDIYGSPLEEEKETTRRTMGKKNNNNHNGDPATEVRVKTWSCCGINPYTRLTCTTNNDERYQ